MPSRFVRTASALAAVSLCTPAEAAVLAGWSQYGANGTVEARAITDESRCPTLEADGRSLTMRERSAPTGAFPVRVCIGTIPAGTRALEAGSLHLPVPVPRPNRLVVFADTGCRLKGEVVQDCADEASWPFHEVAEHAAQERPDLMIHLGDFVYREAPCRAGDRRCAGTPWGDSWATWNADFFRPAAPLLRRTVWLMARGNHEDCRRNGIGWTTFLGHDAIAEPCHVHDSPLLADLGGVTIAVLDDSDAADRVENVNPAATQRLRQDIAAALGAGADWLVTHHPFRGIAKPDTTLGGDAWEGANATLGAALAGVDESPLMLLLAGHIHSFQMLNFPPPLAPQLIIGEGGAQLQSGVPPRLTGLVTGGERIDAGLSLPGFGYVVMDRIGRGQDWSVTVHARQGAVLRRCRLEARRLSCSPLSGPATSSSVPPAG